MRKIQALFLVVFLFLTWLTPAQAQSSARLSLYNLQTSSFPEMTASLDLFDSAGNFVTGLTPETITLIEDNQPRQINSIEDLQPGTEFALALDPNPFFAYRDANAITRFDKIVKVIQEWAATYPASLNDDLSLVPNGGTPATHLAKMVSFLDALAAYQPNFQRLISTPQTLSLALDVVSEPTSQTGRKPVVLYVTSIPALGDIPALQNLTQRAVAGNIRVQVWIVASQDYFSTSGVTALKDLAIQTNGQVVYFSGVEPLPSPETYLAPLRHNYRLEYSSAILTSGGHTLTAQVDLDAETVTSSVLSFELDIQPPNPIMVSPPVQIVRTAPDDHTTSLSSFLPTQQTINIIIEFPDGRTRPLVRTALYVDGLLAVENTDGPFDQFIWDLSSYTTSGQHVLTVEAVDNLGLSKVSLGIPVLVTVIQPKVGLLPWLSRNSLWVTLAAIFLAGGVLIITLARSLARKRHFDTALHSSRRDPLTQSVPQRKKKRILRLPWSRLQKPSEAYLIRLRQDGQPITAPIIPLMAAEITFGSDPTQAMHVVDDLTVSPMHARLKEKNGEYFLTDEKSTSGTWVNYKKVTAPHRLQHGDILHIGRLSYRFMLRKPPERSKPTVVEIKK